MRGDPKGYGNWIAVTCLVAVSVGLVGAATEMRRHVLTRWIRSRLRSIKPRGALLGS